MKYYLIAGEASGDLHGSNLMKQLKRMDSDAEFRVWGGDRMMNEGGVLVKHFRDLAFMGFAEVILNLRTILNNLNYCKQDILNYKPDIVILIDYPGFNLRIAEFVKNKNLKIIYYISPQVWAWKQKRVHKISLYSDRVLCILPFEKEFYQKFGYKVDFVGHPLIDAIENRPSFIKEKRKREFGLDDKPVIALLPGSRTQEISTMLPLMYKAARTFKNYEIVIAAAPSQNIELYQNILKDKKARIISNKTYELLEISEAALVTSGTATLETALFKVPQVVCYKGNWISYAIARQLIKVKYISLVNLIADKVIVTELIQGDLNTSNLKKELKKCLNGESRERILKDYEDLISLLGGKGASQEAAKIIWEEVQG